MSRRGCYESPHQSQHFGQGTPLPSAPSVHMETPRSGPSRGSQRGKALTLGGAKETLPPERTVLLGGLASMPSQLIGSPVVSWGVHATAYISQPV
jgi:hypothetical protein